jgi:hypothetical protein
MTTDIMVSEYVEGITVQLFYDVRIQRWEIASTDNIGCSTQYACNNTRKTIKQIFIEALRGYDDDLCSLPFLEYFPTSCSYSFVLHVDETGTAIPECYLISVYYVNHIIPNTVQYIHEKIYKSWSGIQCVNGLIKFPNKQFFKSYNDIEEEMSFLHDNQKLVLTHLKNGVKTNIQTTEYTLQSKIKQTKKVDIYRFICLNRVNNTYGITKMYKHTKNNLYNTKQIYELFTNYMHKIYIDYFIKRNLADLPNKYKKYILDIHNLYYIKKLKKNVKKPLVKRSDIQTYFNKKTPHELYSLFYKQ